MKGNCVRRLMIIMVLIKLFHVEVQAEYSPPPFLSLLSRLSTAAIFVSREMHNWNICWDLCGRSIFSRRKFYTSFIRSLSKCMKNKKDGQELKSWYSRIGKQTDAHSLARIGSSNSEPFILLALPPPVVDQLCTLDKEGIFCNRLIYF